MTYYDSAAGHRIDYARVIHELIDHGVPLAEYNNFFQDNQPDSKGWYKAQAVLNWLGY